MRRQAVAIFIAGCLVSAWGGGGICYQKTTPAAARVVADVVTLGLAEVSNALCAHPGNTYDDSQLLAAFHEQAEQGNVGAQVTLGAKYEFGDGLPQDYVQADKW